MTEPTTAIEPASDQQRTLATLTMAFTADPVMRWLFPDPHEYLMHFPDFAWLLGERAFEHNAAHSDSDYRAVALWLPPNVEPDEDGLGEFFHQRVAERKQGTAFEVLEKTNGYHPSEPHWYLPLIGVDPSCQGQGRGSALLDHALAECDRQALPAYLESSSPRNIPLYERHGFEVLGEVREEDFPGLWPMLRKPR